VALGASAVGKGRLAGLGRLVVVEREESVAEAARKHFGFVEDHAGGHTSVELLIQDAMEFMLQTPPGAPHAFAAVLVDVAGAVSHHSCEGVLAPPPDFLDAPFVESAASAVRAARGAIAWNVILGAGDSGAGLRSCAEAVERNARDLHVSAVGPMKHDDGTTQWLLMASAQPRPMDGSWDFLEAEGLTWVPAEHLPP